MPDTNQTRRTQETPGDAPELIIFESLFAALTPQEQMQVVQELTSLLALRTA